MSVQDWVESTAALAAVGWVIRTELQIRNLRNALLQSQQQFKDKEISDRVVNISNAELDILLSDKLGRTDGKPVPSPVPKLSK